MLGTSLCTTVLLLGLAVPLRSLAVGAPATSPAGEVSPKVGQFLDLLADPEIQSWVEAHRAATQTQPAADPDSEGTPSSYAARRMAAIQQHLAALAAAIPGLPNEFGRAGASLAQDLGGHPLLVAALLLGFLALGLGAEWLFKHVAHDLKARLSKRPTESAGQHLAAAWVRLGFEAAGLLAFGLGSIALFMTVTWPPLLEQIVLGYLVAVIALRLALIFGRVLLAPQPATAPEGPRFRLLPMSESAARYWYPRLGWLAGWFFFGWVTVGLLRHLDFGLPGRQLVAYLLGMGLLAIGLEAIWARPVPPQNAAGRLPRDVVSWLLSVYFCALYLLWVASALPLFWLSVVIVVVPIAVRMARRAVDEWLHIPTDNALQAHAPSIIEVCLRRGLQDALIVSGALFLAYAWHIDLVALTLGDSVATRLLRGAFSVIIIGLLADLGWQLVKAAIDRKMAQPPASSNENSEAWRRHARLRTLLPIMRNLLSIVLLVMVALLVLATMGVNIAPLIAGAGVVGVAVGFGAQTVVKDIISGMFYLIDDAFRVGEYIQSGSFKGTVESFSLRSVKLRHHRGPLFTVPFGQLGAVENMSRDWVIDKLKVGVAYDTDLIKVKKLIKKIGEALKEDPELGPKILETLKMQGVDEFGDFAITIVMKIMTKPGEQFVVRRRAYAMIKEAFDANGIDIPLPTVQVSGGEAATSVAAHHALAMSQEKPAIP